MIKKILKKVIPEKFLIKYRETRGLYLDGFAVKSYSQEGEDLILWRAFEGKKKGFYVDVGAFHPFWISNTNIFYQNGWNGINIDAMPSSMRLFEKFRPRDINLELPISNKKETLTYYAFENPELNGFSKELSIIRENELGKKIIFQKKMKTKTLEEALDEHLPKGQKIDFLSIDVEGYDYAVLQSNNWEKYRPSIVLVEVLHTDVDRLIFSDVGVYMKNMGYSIFAKTTNTVFFG